MVARLLATIGLERMSGPVASERATTAMLTSEPPPIPNSKGQTMNCVTDDQRLATLRKLHQSRLIEGDTYTLYGDVVDYVMGRFDEAPMTRLEALITVSDEAGLSVALVRQHCELAVATANAVLIAQAHSQRLSDTE